MNQLNPRTIIPRLSWSLKALPYFMLALFTLASLSAELWSNSRPLLMIFGDDVYLPALIDYHPSEFGIHDTLTVDYKNDPQLYPRFTIWPLNRFSPYDIDKTVESYPAPPSRQHWFGTDDRGRDVLARILYGFRYCLFYAVSVWLISAVLAAGLGGFMGYAGGKVDLIGQRLTELLSTLPFFLVLIFLVSVFGQSLFVLAILSSLLGWIGMSHYIRGEVLKVRKLEYIDAAKALGASSRYILMRHVLPNSLTPVITLAPFALVANIMGLAALDYLGFGLAPPTPSWGELLRQGQTHIRQAWWLSVFPTLALFLTLLGLNLSGEQIRLKLNPK